jgi:hypothetical protein
MVDWTSVAQHLKSSAEVVCGLFRGLVAQNLTQRAFLAHFTRSGAQLFRDSGLMAQPGLNANC